MGVEDPEALQRVLLRRQIELRMTRSLTVKDPGDRQVYVKQQNHQRN